ncbi:hypothetical protein HanRHA438_Chr08g0349361 [Helianthus annuus]|nr:hypothetical protein HanHA89_Chr08g0296581 [Helianthus annuus]KAJ0638680.1 hypothetical protein HanHA300_Chr00c0063g0700351 [Helianthus annuus]KAJ0897772.1 hypothetical protein HanRHA438_Chr08g0349361 [Helianthus annuus]
MVLAVVDFQNPLLGETTCGTLLHQLQKFVMRSVKVTRKEIRCFFR